ncbi:C-GCAxxG-C-C family (seleno)protein [Desulfovulcanus sp.]
MDISGFVKERVHDYYWKDDLNCASTTLKILSEFFDINLSNQVMDAAIGMHGAGKYQAQCGLVEGALMFVGILGRGKGISDRETILFCKKLAGEFEKNFGSLLCKILRPEGFHPDNPPHLCEELSCKAISQNIELILCWLKIIHPG